MLNLNFLIEFDSIYEWKEEECIRLQRQAHSISKESNEVNNKGNAKTKCSENYFVTFDDDEWNISVESEGDINTLKGYIPEKNTLIKHKTFTGKTKPIFDIKYLNHTNNNNKKNNLEILKLKASMTSRNNSRVKTHNNFADILKSNNY